MRMTNVAHARQEIGRLWRRGYLFARRNTGRPRNLCLQGTTEGKKYTELTLT